jgi:acetyl esterase/lipase
MNIIKLKFLVILSIMVVVECGAEDLPKEKIHNFTVDTSAANLLWLSGKQMKTEPHEHVLAMCDKSGLNGVAPLIAAQEVPVYDESVPKPTLSGIRYGNHERHILDFWKAESKSPTPLVFVIHGGAWKGGEKERVHRFADVQKLLDAGISVVAINYRLMKHIDGEGIMPPVNAPMYDAARALQFVRTKARDWNIDKQRIGAAGGSAGACTSLCGLSR